MSTRTVGIAFAVNTAVIVALQFLVLSRISGRRRTRVMIVMGLVWALSWLLLGAAGLVPGTAVAAAGMLAFMGVFAFGETLMQPTIPAINNDLAADHPAAATTRSTPPRSRAARSPDRWSPACCSTTTSPRCTSA